MKLESNLGLEDSLVLIRQQLELLSLSINTWSMCDFLIGKKMEINNSSHICKVGIFFSLQKGKRWVLLLYTCSFTDIHTHHHGAADWIFSLLIKGNKVAALLPPLHIFPAELMRLQTAHPTDTVQILPPSLHDHPFFSTDFSLLPCRLVPSFSCLFFALRYGANEMFNY